MQTLTNLAKAFRRNTRGNVGFMFALSLIPATVLTGGTVDYGKALSQKAKLQSAADAAALAGASLVEAPDSDRISLALKVFTSNTDQAGLTGLTPVITATTNRVTVTAVANVPTPFLNLIHIPTLEVSVYSESNGTTEQHYDNEGKVCLLALDPNSDDGIHLQGDNKVKYNDCWAHTNSTKPTAINANGNNAKAEGKGHCAVGNWTQTHETFSPLPKEKCEPVKDPFASVGAYDPTHTYQPNFTPPALAVTCKALNVSLKKGEFTLDPGRYCGGIDIHAGATVKFNPGIYYIDNGVLNVQAGSSANGSNVVFYLAGINSRMQLIGGGTVDLKGRSSGASYAGFLVIQHPDANRGGESNIQGGGTFKLQGVVYMPTQRIEVSGQGDVNNQDIAVFGMVAKDFYFRGNGVFNAKKHDGSGNLPDIMPMMPPRQVRTSVLN